MDRLCYFCLVLLCFHARLFGGALWSHAGKGLTSWLLFMMSNCNFPIGILGQVWYLIVSIPIFALFLTLFKVFDQMNPSRYNRCKKVPLSMFPFAKDPHGIVILLFFLLCRLGPNIYCLPRIISGISG